MTLQLKLSLLECLCVCGLIIFIVYKYSDRQCVCLLKISANESFHKSFNNGHYYLLFIIYLCAYLSLLPLRKQKQCHVINRTS